jgi:pimeloyl-ACP methyl ester carboxylesterase
MTSWVLLRGLTREARHWGDFVPAFAAALSGAQVHAVDLPGNGRLNGMRSPATVAGLTDAVRAELSAQGVAAPYRLVAMSLGAMVAADWAQRHSQELTGAVLINTSLRPFSPVHHRLRLRSVPALLRLLVGAHGDRDAERAVLALTSRCRVDDAALLDTWARWRRERRVSRANALRQLAAALRYRAPANAPPVPLLVLASAQDALVDPRCSATLAARWNAAFALHSTAGHDLPLDDGTWVAAQVRDWLQAATASANSASI